MRLRFCVHFKQNWAVERETCARDMTDRDSKKRRAKEQGPQTLS